MSSQKVDLEEYELIERIGVGGSCDVYRARHKFLRREDALKLLRSDYLTNEKGAAQFLAEAQNSALPVHPNIAHVYSAKFKDGQAYIAIELLQGQTLRERLNQGPLTENEAVKVVLDVLSALEHAHSNGVIHCDIKPENVFLCTNGVAKVVDFGIARVLNAEQQGVHATTFGTPAYMSPEQAQGVQEQVESDLYSTGILLYEMLTGSVPFKADDSRELLQKHVHELPPPLPSPFSPTLNRILAQALSKKPEQRFRSAQAMADTLRDYRQKSYGNNSFYLVRSRKGYLALVGVLLIAFLGAATWLRQARTPSAEREQPAHSGAAQRINLEAEGEIQQAQKYINDISDAHGSINSMEKQAEREGRFLTTAEQEQARKTSMEIKQWSASALQHANHAIELDDSNSKAYFQKGYALWHSGEIPQAQKFVQEALSKFPEDTQLNELFDTIRASR